MPMTGLPVAFARAAEAVRAAHVARHDDFALMPPWELSMSESVNPALIPRPGRTLPAPRTAEQAAKRLLDEGEHVHYISEGHATCPTGTCTP